MHSIFRLFSDNVVGFFLDVVFYNYTKSLYEKSYYKEKRNYSNRCVNHNRQKSVKENLSAVVVLPYCIEEKVMEYALTKRCSSVEHNNVDDMPSHKKMEQQRRAQTAPQHNNSAEADKRTLRRVKEQTCHTADNCRVKWLLIHCNAHHNWYNEKRRSESQRRRCHIYIGKRHKQSVDAPSYDGIPFFLLSF